jgi:signal transduction histidine kinase
LVELGVVIKPLLSKILNIGYMLLKYYNVIFIFLHQQTKNSTNLSSNRQKGAANMRIILKTYRLFLVLLLLCLVANAGKAQGSSANAEKPIAFALADVNAFYRQLTLADQELKLNHFQRAQQKVLAAETLLKKIQGDQHPTLCADLALAFAKVNMPEKAKNYQARAAARPRGNATLLSLAAIKTLGESYALLADQQGLKTMFEKVIATVPATKKVGYKIAYVNGLFGVNDNAKASTVLTALYSDQPLSAPEHAEILSLLMINSIKLKELQRIDQYYSELIALKAKPSANSYLAMGMYFSYKNKVEMAKRNFNQLLKEFNAGRRGYVYDEALLQLANLLSIQLKRDSASFYFAKLAATLKKPIQSTSMGNNYLKLLRAHQLRFNQPSTITLDGVKDSLYRQELIAATEALNYKHKIEQDKQKTALAKKQRAIEQLVFDKKRQRLLWIISSLALLIITGGIIIYLLYQRKKQSNLLHLTELEKLKQQHKADVIKKLSDSQEAERWRIADQLHDEVGSMISVVRLNLSEHPLKNEAISPEKLETANRILANVADTVREMSHQLMPVAIRQYGLINAIEQLITDINTAGKVYIEHLIHGFDDVSKYPEDFQISFYRIVQELFQNIVKHSKATNAIFQLIEHPDSINLYIEDNGKGIDNKNDAKTGKGMGLLTNRIDYFEGKISIEGAPGKGTLIVIDIPTGHMISAGHAPK